MTRSTRKQSEPNAPRHRNAKDTRRWCKGVVGREHQYVWTFWLAADWKNKEWWRQVCQNCKRRGGFEERGEALGK